MYAKNGWHTNVCSFEYTLFAALSTLVAGILLLTSGMFVVARDRGNISVLSFFAPVGDMK